MEARGHSEHPEALRLWLRMLTCTQLVEKQVRTQLREQFDTTLPRFDLMAQLERSPEGLKMNELSRRMMVTGGNVTGITDQLVTEGLVERVDVEGDRRAYRVRLTTRGRKLFDEMANEHEAWIVAAFEGLSRARSGVPAQAAGQGQAAPQRPLPTPNWKRHEALHQAG
jgi:DNA-binding MarR family transcriptional regulator